MKNELEKAQAAFEAIQGEIRDYGKEKRSAFNDHFRTNVTTVAIPYGDEKAVQVICANRYSVKKDLILNNQDALGPAFNDLFVVETTKKLRADGEQRLLALLLEVGLDAETSQQILDKLVDVEHTVKTVEDYEQKEKLVTNPGAREVLIQAVSRAAPALKFIG
jgi:predicted transcriptional regulator